MVSSVSQAQLPASLPRPRRFVWVVPASDFICTKVPAGSHANCGGEAAEEGSPIQPLLEDLEPKTLVLPKCFALVSFRSIFFFT